MPTMTGIELMGSLNQKPFVVFVTSHKDFALEAFDLNAVDYLTKPIKKERLLSAVEKVEILVKMYKKSLDGELMGMPENSYFFVKDKGVLHRVFYKDVLYIQAMGDFSTIFLENGQKKIALVGIKNFEQQLSSDNFLRISRTHLVNTQKITALTNDSVFMEKIEISIGSTFQEEVFKKIVDGKVIKRFV
jgi:DNA-binding LytR/AlgR family response regulator